MNQSTIKYVLLDRVAVIRLSDPPTLNAMSLAMVEELQLALQKASTSARAIVLTGEGRAFCSGANIGGDLDPSVPGYDAGAGLETHYNPLMRQMRDLPIPIVSAVNGPAAGIGASVALAADMILVAQSAYFLQAFRRIGLVPDGGSAFLLVHAAGRPRAMEMMLLGERIPAAQALEWGLINRVIADSSLDEAALALAVQLADGPTQALGSIRRLAWQAMQSGFTEMLAMERELQLQSGRSADHRAGIEAFLNKQPAKFSGT
jgi:2-(1,2-epoxy-1,2-dihydrophenyl)acetyl-CoA isomerase